jgi:hypothetical protein
VGGSGAQGGGSEKEDDPDRGSHLSAVWKKNEKKIGEGGGARAAAGLVALLGPGRGPVGLLLFFFCSGSFSFSVLRFVSEF